MDDSECMKKIIDSIEDDNLICQDDNLIGEDDTDYMDDFENMKISTLDYQKEITEILGLIDKIKNIKEESSIEPEDKEKLVTLIQYYILKYMVISEQGFFDYSEDDDDYYDKVHLSNEISVCINSLEILGYIVFRTQDYPDEIVERLESIQKNNIPNELMGPVLSLNYYAIYVI
jgi:hypothetical protein